MDIKRGTSSKKTINRRYQLAAVLIFLVIWIIFKFQSSQNHKVDSSSLAIAEVKRGNLPLEVKGFGVLESERKRLITVPFSAVVEEILLKPGATVQSDSVILRMSNPEIDQAVLQAQQIRNNAQVALKQLQLEHQKENMINQNKLADIQFDAQEAKTKYLALKPLAEQGVVSQFDLLTSEIKVKKLESSLKFTQKSITQLADLHRQAEQILLGKLEEKQSLLALAIDRQQQLEVTAGIEGVLQNLPVELGQNMQSGDKLALVGGTQKLLAVVQIPQRDIKGMKVGMPANVDTRGGVAKATVRRIEPVVKGGNIEVELELIGQLPENARPALNIEAQINLGELNDILYLQTPVNSEEYSQKKVFRLFKDNIATATQLNFGARSGKYIEIKSGGNEKESFILNDMQKYIAQGTVTLTN
ncbi:MAG: HlyD family secretion protein [Pseudoalteromonas prydzensis]|uniref:HlyD family secretion protein n=1 Tax=Pseudoalteromonas prydzensis TaxID=182141 RepID=UPI003F97E59F